MIDQQPQWTLDRRQGISSWPGRVRLVGSSIISEWYRLNRDDGSLVWERSPPKVNYITGVENGLILGATIQPGWSPGLGACALTLSDGEVIWSGEFSPVSLKGGEFLCMDGTTRDLRTAQIVGRQAPPRESDFVMRSHSDRLEMKLELCQVGESIELLQNVLVQGTIQGDYLANTRDGKPLWEYSPMNKGWFCGPTLLDRFIAPPFIYLVASRDPQERRIDAKTIESIPARRFLLTLDLRSGSIVQELDLGIWKGPCGVEDVDPEGVLLRFVSTRLAYYHRAA